jgi:hypothetical protein
VTDEKRAECKHSERACKGAVRSAQSPCMLALPHRLGYSRRNFFRARR